YRDPSDEDPWQGQTDISYIPPQIVVKDHVSVLPDFRVMRLTADGSTEKLVVTTLLPDGTEKIVYARSIVDLIRLTGHYNTQQQIDQTNDYTVVVDFRCVDKNHQHGSTWFAATIWVNNWVVKEVDSEI
ncbi:MAG: FimB/Mfa2 family fimbrial subunit, partial [Tannerellaceae bacterium]